MSCSIVDLEGRVEEEFVDLGIVLTVLSRASCAMFVAFCVFSSSLWYSFS